MKTIYTHAEAEKYIEYTKENYDFVRLVSPKERKVCDLHTGAMTGEICHDFWNRRERCENCTSNRALQTKGRAIKLESVGDQTYIVVSKYVEIDGTGNVMEALANITEDFSIETDDKNSFGPIIDNLNRQLITDPLTGVYNRRFLDDNFVPSLDCCYDRSSSINVAIMDIDDFKNINDTYGHIAGDILLKDVASFWKSHFDSRINNRERIVARIGGDEFLIIGCGISGNKFRQLVSIYYSEMRKTCYYRGDLKFDFNISIGFSSSDDIGEGWTWEGLFNAADEDMYESKKSAR